MPTSNCTDALQRSIELQGHAIKNQDLLAASGAVSLKGSAGMSALDEDMEAAAQVRHIYNAGFSSAQHDALRWSLTCSRVRSWGRSLINLIQSHESAVLRQVTMADVNLEARDRELTEIARSISELAELFKDLSAMVIDQGTLLDSVEYNVEQTAAHMEDAVRELDTATR